MCLDDFVYFNSNRQQPLERREIIIIFLTLMIPKVNPKIFCANFFPVVCIRFIEKQIPIPGSRIFANACGHVSCQTDPERNMQNLKIFYWSTKPNQIWALINPRTYHMTLLWLNRWRYTQLTTNACTLYRE